MVAALVRQALGGPDAGDAPLAEQRCGGVAERHRCCDEAENEEHIANHSFTPEVVMTRKSALMIGNPTASAA